MDHPSPFLPITHSSGGGELSQSLKEGVIENHSPSTRTVQTSFAHFKKRSHLSGKQK